jgi:hypothetical protein
VAQQTDETTADQPKPLAFEMPVLIGLLGACLYEMGWTFNYAHTRLLGLPLVDIGNYGTLLFSLSVLGSIGDSWQPLVAVILLVALFLAVHANRPLLSICIFVVLFGVIPMWSYSVARQTVEEEIRSDRFPTVTFVLGEDARQQEPNSDVFESINAQGHLRLLREESDIYHVFEHRTTQGGSGILELKVFVIPRSSVRLVEIKNPVDRAVATSVLPGAFFRWFFTLPTLVGE